MKIFSPFQYQEVRIGGGDSIEKIAAKQMDSSLRLLSSSKMENIFYTMYILMLSEFGAWNANMSKIQLYYTEKVESYKNLETHFMHPFSTVSFIL